MWYEKLTNYELQALHDALSRTLFLLLDTLPSNLPDPGGDLPVPDWANQMSVDVRGMYEELWVRRDTLDGLSVTPQGDPLLTRRRVR